MTADKITEPGSYAVTKAEYESDPVKAGPSLRASIAWKLVAPGSTPAHAAYEHPRLNPNYQREEKRHFTLGTAAHTMLLGKGAKIVVLDAEDYKTKAARETRDAAFAAGHTPLLPHEHKQVSEMVAAARQQMRALVDAGTIEAMPFQVDETERSLFWVESNGVWCRASMDGFSVNDDAIGEYKTEGESADPATWQWKARRLGYPFRLAFYRRGLEKLKISYSPEFRVFCQETKPPYLMSFVRVDDELIAREDERVKQAIKIFGRCLENGVWPGYSLSGYDLGLTERERQVAVMGNGAANPADLNYHLSSEDQAAGVNVPTKDIND